MLCLFYAINGFLHSNVIVESSFEILSHFNESSISELLCDIEEKLLENCINLNFHVSAAAKPCEKSYFKKFQN